jgi:predicted DNA-binding protein
MPTIIQTVNGCSPTMRRKILDKMYIPLTGMQQTPLPVNHLALNGKPRPVQQFDSSKKLPVTISLPSALMERLRNAVYWTGDRPLASLVAEAIENVVTQLEDDIGGAFPLRVSALRRGRPRKATPRPLDDPFS